MTRSILITVLVSKDFKCDLGNFIQEMQRADWRAYLRNIEENRRKHPAATQEVSTPSVLRPDTDCYGCLLVSKLPGCLQGSAPHCQRASALVRG